MTTCVCEWLPLVNQPAEDSPQAQQRYSLKRKIFMWVALFVVSGRWTTDGGKTYFLPLSMLPSDRQYIQALILLSTGIWKRCFRDCSCHCRSLPPKYLCTKVSDRKHTPWQRGRVRERTLLVSLYPDMLLCVFFWLQYTNNSRGPGLGNRFTWGICLGSTWKGIISRVSRNEKGKQWPGLGDSVYNLIVLKMKLSVQPRGDGFFSSGQGRGWLTFLALPDTVANQVYLFCEFSATQVSSTFFF